MSAANERAELHDGASLVRSDAGGRTGSEQLPSLLHRVAEAARRAGDADGAQIERILGARAEIEVVAVAGSVLPPVGLRLPFPGSLAEGVLDSDEPQVIDDVAFDESPMGRILRDSCGACSVVVLPLLADGESLGALLLVRRAGRNGFTAGEAARARLLADLAALALQLARDMSERRSAERSLQQLSAQYRAVYDENPTMFVTTAADCTILDVNDYGAHYLGYERTTMIGRSALDFVVAADHDSYTQHIEMALAAPGVAFRTEVRKLTRSGVIWARDTSRAMQTAAGDITLLHVCEDITDRVKVEDELRLLADASRQLAGSLEWEQTLRTVAELLVPRMADWCAIDVLEDGELRRVAVTHADPARAALAARYHEHYPADAASTTGAAEVMRTGKPVLIPQIDAAVLASVARDAEHLRMLTEMGFGSALVVPLSTDGRVLGTITLIAAGSGRCFGTEDLRVAELMASRAALALDQARLYRAARAATQARDEVLSIVSHDLRNPLNTILMSAGFLSDLGDTADAQTRQRQLEIVQRQAHQMNRMIQDLLDVARIEAGRLPVNEQRESPASIARDAADAVRPLAEDGGLHLDVAVSDDLPMVCVDRERIQQVLSNLLGNALKFTPRGGRIALRARHEGGFVHFAVADTGAGIAAADLPHLFERFYQVRESGRGGAGLGLAIAKGIVETHGGQLTVESEPGRGSTFSFCVPVAA